MTRAQAKELIDLARYYHEDYSEADLNEMISYQSALKTTGTDSDDIDVLESMARYAPNMRKDALIELYKALGGKLDDEA